MGDMTDSGGVEKCGNHPKSTSDDCGRQTGWGRDSDSGPCKDHYSEGATNSDTDPSKDGSEVPSEEALGELADCIIDAVGYTPKESDSRSTQAGKAWVKWAEGGKEMYISLFDECANPSCERGCNGFEPDYCNIHQDQDPDDDDSSESSKSDKDLEDRVNNLEDKMDKILDHVS